MYRVVNVCFISYGFIILFVISQFSEGSSSDVISHDRPRRYLNFMNKSTFFIRLNFKANMVPWNQIFQQALGFRMNWNEPPEKYYNHKHFINRRSLYESVETILDSHGLSGFHCVQKAICEIDLIEKPIALYHKILKIIFGKRSEATGKWEQVSVNDCNVSVVKCPLSILEVSRFTDV